MPIGLAAGVQHDRVDRAGLTTVPSTVRAREEPGHEVPVEQIHDDIGTGLNLGDTGIGAGDVVGPGAAHGDDFAGEARTAQAVHDGVQLVDRLPGLGDPQRRGPVRACNVLHNPGRRGNGGSGAGSGAAPAPRPRRPIARRLGPCQRRPRSGPRAGSRRPGLRGRARRSCADHPPPRSSRPCRLARARARILSLPQTWLAIKTSSMPARLMTIASQTVAVQTPMAPD